MAHVPSKITLVTAPWKRRRVHPIAKVIGTHPARGARSNNKSRKQGGNFLRTRTPMHLQRKGNFEDDEKTSESLNFQKKGNFEDNEKTSSRVQRHSCNQEDIIGTTFCSCVAFSDCTPRRLRSSTFRLEPRRTQQSTAAIWQGQRSSSKCRHKRSQNWKHQREKEVQLHCGKVGCGPDLPRTSSIRRSSVKKIAKSGTTSRPRMTSWTTSSTNVSRQNEKHFGAAAESQMSTISRCFAAVTWWKRREKMKEKMKTRQIRQMDLLNMFRKKKKPFRQDANFLESLQCDLANPCMVQWSMLGSQYQQISIGDFWTVVRSSRNTMKFSIWILWQASPYPSVGCTHREWYCTLQITWQREWDVFTEMGEGGREGGERGWGPGSKVVRKVRKENQISWLWRTSWSLLKNWTNRPGP